jgi:hypothetical protein
MAKTPTMKLTKDSSFQALIKGWKRSPANMGVESSLNFLIKYKDTIKANKLYKAERLLLRHHQKAFLAWLKLQQ